jgi:hypothetical protein
MNLKKLIPDLERMSLQKLIPDLERMSLQELVTLQIFLQDYVTKKHEKVTAFKKRQPQFNRPDWHPVTRC